MKIGVCYYPEHWPESEWPAQASHMVELGITVVRIGEFAWSRLEPSRNSYQFDWLERATNVLHDAGLKVVLCTPTATPPRWLVQEHPDMLAVDEAGQTRDFGSRRHYCFSYLPYREECARITEQLCKRFASHPAIVAWQTDNEYGCHSTTLSYSKAAIEGFQTWCSEHYSSIDALNSAWGNVFWSMEYANFTQIGSPAGTVTEANPSHRMAFWRYTSDQVVAFNKLQVDIIKRHSDVDVLHNFMGNFVEFDHFDVAESLDIATWDNYPLGFLTRDSSDKEQQSMFMRTGDPDSSSFHHSLYRAVGRGRMWVMEQQPGPVNWAPFNPAPLPGMVRLWGLEAYAHGAEVMSYFRYRQAPFAQEQMHTGLCLSNGEEDVAAAEVRQLSADLNLLQQANALCTSEEIAKAPVAMIFDYAGDQLQRIQQPLGEHFDPLVFAQRIYAACRELGLDVDIVSPDAKLDSYELILLPNLTCAIPALVKKLQHLDARVVLFPRSGSKSHELTIPEELPPGAFQQLIDLQIVCSESLPQQHKEVAFTSGAKSFTAIDWREKIKTHLKPDATFSDGWGFHFQHNRVHYINAVLRQESLLDLLESICEQQSLKTNRLGKGVRTTCAGPVRFVFNFGPDAISLSDPQWKELGLGHNTELLLGEYQLPAAQVAAWRIDL